eukprot:Blabericola_migrator_1__7876@NODE_402_length_8862_cov_53_826265_g319_i0_p1_GENE_NODE_402_length_8862_cov_53_826265_g319_i0NODE_402_length_8862_cov_53_826265_g319_i0_p1_ORF_typecomplete_len493_score107_07CPL/PF08144_11/3_1e02CPL/PF08144_11/3_2e03CPL/PF08144_11/7e02CPL/PF08144_11/3_4MAS20/PF02064_15/1_3MAS20/PF02064_15/9_8e03_NODE_402_length_8862_cov_53_826265_g319_i023823860
MDNRKRGKDEAFGRRVRKRRQEIAKQLEGEGLSISKRRKLAKEVGKEEKQPLRSFDKSCGVLYNEILQNMKKGKTEEPLQKLADLLWSGVSPLSTINAGSDTNDVMNAFARPNISRCLQLVLKLGTSEQKDKLCEQLKDFLPSLATTGSGYHLCLRLLSAVPRKSQLALIKILLDKPKTFHTKYGAKLWDAALQKCGNATLRTRMLTLVFFDKVSKEIPEDQRESIEALIKALPPAIHKGQREMLIAKFDKLVKKELLSSSLCHYMLAELCRLDHEFVNDYLLKAISESIFDGAAELLTTREGVTCLCRLIGHWDAKQKKTFLTAVKGMMSLQKRTWHEYFVNEVDGLFVTRLLATLDDTKVATETILASIFGVKYGKTGLKPLESTEKIVNVFGSAKCCFLLVGLLIPDKMRSFLSPEEYTRLLYPSPASKKDCEVRCNDLLVKFFKPLDAMLKAEKVESLSQILGEVDELNTLQKQHHKALELLEATINR